MATVLKKMGSDISLYKIKKNMSITTQGSSIKDIIETAAKYELNAVGLKGSFEELIHSITTKGSVAKFSIRAILG